MGSYKDLRVWQRSIDLVEKVYELTKEFPREEVYGLTSQLRRAAVSIPANIAEGSGRGTKKDYTYFLTIAYGSCCEMETLCTICQRLGFVSVKEAEILQSLLSDVSRMLKALRKVLKD
jgi:four helix bundle protein